MIPNRSTEDLYVDAALRHLVTARNHLQCAVFRFDDAGIEHEPVARSYSYVSGIVAEFKGRPYRPVVAPEPSHVEVAAREYRRMAGRGY